MNLIPTDATGIYREASSGGLINTNKAALEAYKKKKQMNRAVAEMEVKQAQIEQKLSNIENDMSQIKDILLELIAKY